MQQMRIKMEFGSIFENQLFAQMVRFERINMVAPLTTLNPEISGNDTWDCKSLSD